MKSIMSSKRKTVAVRKSEEELDLEEFLFGRDILGVSTAKRDESHDIPQDEIEITIDKAPSSLVTKDGASRGSSTVWHDEDDEDIEVDLNATNRLKKLRREDTNESRTKRGSIDKNGIVTGEEYSNLLQERFQTRKVAWAQVAAITTANGASAGDDNVALYSMKKRGLDEEDLALLTKSNGFGVNLTRKQSKTSTTSTTTATTTGVANGRLPGGNSKRARKLRARAAVAADTYNSTYSAHGMTPLPTNHIDIQRLVNANIAAPSQKRINALDFHSNGDVLLVAGEDKFVRFFRIDGEQNDLQLSVKVQDMSIFSAFFRPTMTGFGNGITNGSSSSTTTSSPTVGAESRSVGVNTSSEVILSGRKPFFYTYDLIQGALRRIPVPAHITTLNSTERAAVSPQGTLLAFAGASGYVHYCSGGSKQWVGRCKGNSAVRSLTFLDEWTLATSGVDAEVCVWDVRATARCVTKFSHNDGTCSSHLSAYVPPEYTMSRLTAGTVVGVGCGSGGGSGSGGGINYPQGYHARSAYLAVGAESGVTSIYDAYLDSAAGTYDFTTTSAAHNSINYRNNNNNDHGNSNDDLIVNISGSSTTTSILPRKSILNLTTPIHLTCYHPSGQLLAIASDQKQDQLKLVHTASGSVFGNWPSASKRTPLNRVTAMAFSKQGGGYFAVGNVTGKVLLYRLKHFGIA